jgi:hypothetical protein
VDPVKAELGPRAWRADVEDWLRRARRGPGVRGQYDSRTAYFWGERSWGGPLVGPCKKKVDRDKKDEGGKGGKNKGPGGGGGDPAPDGDPPDQGDTALARDVVIRPDLA